MAEPHTPPPSGPAPPGDRLDAALLDATRDMKGYFARELDAKLAITEERLQATVAEVTADLKGIHVKLAAMREELRQSLRDQTLRMTLLAVGAAFFTVATLLLISRWMR